MRDAWNAYTPFERLVSGFKGGGFGFLLALSIHYAHLPDNAALADFLFALNLRMAAILVVAGMLVGLLFPPVVEWWQRDEEEDARWELRQLGMWFWGIVPVLLMVLFFYLLWRKM